MNNEYYGAPTTPTSDYLAHYGVKGMKWGVRKAIASGNAKRLGRQYAKAQKKLAKLEKRAVSGKKYAKRAAALGVGAAGMGAVAATGTSGVANAMKFVGSGVGEGMRGLGSAAKYASGVMAKHGIRGAGKMGAAGQALTSAGSKAQYGVGTAAGNLARWGKKRHDIATAAYNLGGKYAGTAGQNVGKQIGDTLNKYGRGSISNSGLVRLGAAGVGAGLAAGAGYNAYRAATTKRAAKKAAQFRSEMNKAFAGTQYANGRNTKKRRRRS